MDITLYNDEDGQTELVTINNNDELKMLTEAYFNIIPENQLFKYNGNMLNLTNEFVNHGLKSGDMLTVCQHNTNNTNNTNNQNNANNETINEFKDQLAMDSYIPHTLIYVCGEINDICFRIIIDTGAAISIMSESTVKLLKIENLIDTRSKGKVVGVGNSNLLGSINGCNLKIGNNFFVPANFRIMEDSFDKYIIILGLDFLNSHKCKLDFVSRTIEVEGEPIKFLNELEVENFKHPFNVVEKRLTESYNKFKQSIDKEINEINKANIMNLIQKIINNILNNPTENKYKTINASSKIVQSLGSRVNSFIEYLLEIGFVEEDGDKDKNRYSFNGQINHLNLLVAIMNK